jgi:hypothetical protein
MALARICLHAIAARRQDQYVSESTQRRLNPQRLQKTNRKLSYLAGNETPNKRQTNNYQQSAVFQIAEGDGNLSFDRSKQILVMQFWTKR